MNIVEQGKPAPAQEAEAPPAHWPCPPRHDLAQIQAEEIISTQTKRKAHRDFVGHHLGRSTCMPPRKRVLELDAHAAMITPYTPDGRRPPGTTDLHRR